MTGNRFVLALLIAPFFLIATTNASCQEMVDSSVMKRIRTEGMDHSSIPDLAYHLLDLCGPRLTNSNGYNRAVSWTVQQLKDWGMVNAAPEAYGEYGKGWDNNTATISMKSPYATPMLGYAVPWTASTPGKISAGVIFIDRLDSASIDKLGDSIKGRIVLIRIGRSTIPLSTEAYTSRYTDSALAKMHEENDMDSTNFAMGRMWLNRLYRTRLYLAQKGALALINSNPQNKYGNVYVSSFLGYAAKLQPTLPEMMIDAEDYFRIQRLVQHGQPVTLDLDLQNTWNDKDLTGYNVVAEIPGTDPKLKEQVVMLGGHLDSWTAGTGATDNGAGVIVAMEALRIIQSLGIKPRRTIRIALWGGEEQVLLGSWGYVKKHFGDPATMKFTREWNNLSAYFNLDNGSGKIRGIFQQNNEAVKPIFDAWLKPFNDLGATTTTLANTGSTDHISFDALGLPGFQFIQDPLEYETLTHHSNMDVSDHLSIPDMKQAAVVLAAFVYNTAMRNEMLPRKPLPRKGKFLFEGGLLE